MIFICADVTQIHSTEQQNGTHSECLQLKLKYLTYVVFTSQPYRHFSINRALIPSHYIVLRPALSLKKDDISAFSPSFGISGVNHVDSGRLQQPLCSTAVSIHPKSKTGVKTRPTRCVVSLKTLVLTWWDMWRKPKLDTHRAQCRGVKGFPSSWIHVLNSSKTSKQSSCPKKKHTQHCRQQMWQWLIATFRD